MSRALRSALTRESLARLLRSSLAHGLHWSDAMRKNTHDLDRLVRLVIGIGLLASICVGPKTSWGWLGLIPLATALVGWCPLYQLVGLDTCNLRRQRQA